MAAFSYTAPQFTEQDSMKERASMTADQIQKIENECLGQNISIFEETPELVEAAIHEMARHLAAIDNKPAYDKALQLVPDLVQKESPAICFLRCEYFSPEKAAQRLVKYWDMRSIIFGSKAFLPMRLDGALQDDIETIKDIPEAYFITGKDDHGRLIFFANKARLDFSRHNRMSVMRCMWYQFHIHLDDLKVHNCGFVGVGHFRIDSPKQFDRIQSKMSVASVKDALPVNLVCIHMCHTPLFFNFVFPMIKFILGKDMRLRTKTHYGSEDKVLQELEHYGIHRSLIFKSMGGGYDLNVEEWLAYRQRIESANQLFEGQVGQDILTDAK